MVLSGEKTIFQGRAKQILVKVADNSGEIQTLQLAEIIGITYTNISQYLTALRNADFVTSARSGYDKRFVYHSLTLKGREFLDGLADGSSDRPVKDLTSQAERAAELEGQRQIKKEELEENLDALLEDSHDLVSEEEKKLDFDDDDTMSF